MCTMLQMHAMYVHDYTRKASSYVCTYIHKVLWYGGWPVFLPLPLLSLEDIGTSKLPIPICYVDKEEETYVQPKGIILFKTLKG